MLFSIGTQSASPTANTSGRLTMGKAFVAVWLLLWSLVTLAADVIILVMMVQTMLAWSYPAASGTITQSQVRHEARANGDVVQAGVTYQFRVNDRDITGSRLSFFDAKRSDPQEVARVVESLPVGKQIVVFYNPTEPRDCALDRSLAGRPLYLGMLLLPFNLVMVGGWRWALRSHRGVRNLPMWLEGDRWIVRRSRGSPFAVALIVAGLLDLAAIFFLSPSDLSASFGAMSLAWLTLIGLTWLAYWHTWSSARSEPPVLIADNAARTLSWPATSADSTDDAPTIAVAQLRAVELDESVTTATNGATDLSFLVTVSYLAKDGQAMARLVLKTTDGHEAETLADWLDDWSGLRQRPQITDAVNQSATVE